MHLHHLPLPLLLLVSNVAAVGPVWSLAEDTYAFPKYRITFLNGLPVLNDTAERWLAVGLKGGEREFLDQPWQEQTHQEASASNAIESGDAESSNTVPISSSRYRLERMQLAGKSPYICLIPPPVESHTKPIEEPQIEATAAQSLSLLQPLASSCIYHRQGWFTYAYCHNNQVRQFREMVHSHPHHAGYVPEEDPDWEAFTLGQAVTIPSEGHELTTAQQETLANSVDIVKTAGHRYLVQKMGDGTICDKTGKPREIEVQFHCSQTMSDTILFVKETSTCHYVMVIHTPRLCGEPGFRTRLEQREEAPIRCREVLDSEEAVAAVDKTLPTAAQPFKRRARKPILDIPPPPPAAKEDGNAPGAIDKKTAGMIKAAIEAFISGNSDYAAADLDLESGEAILVTGEDGEMLIDIEFIDAEETDEAMEKLEGLLGKASGKLGRLEEALRAAGYDVSGLAASPDSKDAEEEKRKKRPEDEKRKPKHDHEEL